MQYERNEWQVGQMCVVYLQLELRDPSVFIHVSLVNTDQPMSIRHNAVSYIYILLIYIAFPYKFMLR
jgi:hypothetical protein